MVIQLAKGAQARSLDIIGPGREPADHNDEVSFQATVYPDESLFVTVCDTCDLLKVYEACDRVAEDRFATTPAWRSCIHVIRPKRNGVAAYDPKTHTGWSDYEFIVRDECRRVGDLSVSTAQFRSQRMG